jgi:SNF2 family DNA or RNA helicase
MIPQLFLTFLREQGVMNFEFGENFPSGPRRALSDYASSQSQLVLPAAQNFRLSLFDAFNLLREFLPKQKVENYRFKASDETTASVIEDFISRMKSLKESQGSSTPANVGDIPGRLLETGFDKRVLTDFQERDLGELIRLQSGANFSVPGAGKTTVTMALNALVMGPKSKMLVVCPKSAFQAWEEVIGECFSSPSEIDQFERLSGDLATVRKNLGGPNRRFLINYDILEKHKSSLVEFLFSNEVHLVMDESHRIKGGLSTERGTVALELAPFAERRDILSGTPMPQGSYDIASQVDFLWPGANLGEQIRVGAQTPTLVMNKLFVRTKKSELGLPDPLRHFESVPMSQEQQIVYSVLRDDALRQLSSVTSGNPMTAANRSNVIRLLQASVYPVLCARSLPTQELIELAIESGPGAKMLRAAEMARENASEALPRKTVIWTIFTETLKKLHGLLADLNPVVIYGGNSQGVDGLDIDRDVAIRRFKTDKNSMVLIANPAAASEGLSLHTVAHDAIYVDRTYNAAHFLQSIDRIHRLGLRSDVVTNITILQSATPQGIGNIDRSVSRRLSQKVSDLNDLLNDADLREIMMSEDDAPLPIDDDVTRDDIADLVSELSNPRPATPDDV